MFHTTLTLYMFTQACREQRPTTVELQLVVEIIQLLLDVRGTRTVITGAERQQHVDLEYKKNRAIQLLFRATRHDPGFVHLYRFGLDLKWVFLYPASLV